MKKTFTWKGISKEGSYEKGNIEAPNIRLAQAYLKEKGIHKIISIKHSLPLGYFRLKRQKPFKFTEITLFFKNLVTLLSSGIPLMKALNTIQLHFASPPFKSWIQEIYHDVSAGYPLSHSLKQYPKFITPIICQWIESGEQSGKIEKVLAQLVADREKQWQYRQKVKSLLIYPLFVITTAIALVITLLVWVIPQWATLFAGSQNHLPFLTQIILKASAFLRSYGLELIFICVLGFLCFRSLLKTKRIYQKWWHLKWRIPYLRGLYRDHFLMHWTQLLALSLSAGIPLIQSLQSLKNADSFLFMQTSMRAVLLSLETGHSFTSAIQHMTLFPPFMVQMVAIGEESGHLEEMVQKAGEFYEAEFERKLRNLLQLLEPFIITVLGFFIGMIVMGMYLPIFQLGDISGAF